MKKIFKYTFLSLLVLGSTTGCSKLEDFGDTNVNPAGAKDPIVGALLTNVMAGTTALTGSNPGLGGFATQTRPGLYGQYFSETQYTDVSLYSAPQIDFNNLYSGALFDLQNIIDQNKSKNMNTIAKILQQYIFWTITDRWGDVPYSAALKGATSLTPKYDKQEDIYKAMMAALASSVNEFDNSIITGDIIFNGDVAAWKRFANSLRMMMAIQLSKKVGGPDGFAAAEFKAALNNPAGYISTNAQNVKVSYPGGNFKNSWWGVYDGRKDYAESKTMTDLMASLGDSRQNAFGGITQDQGKPNSFTTSSVGMPYGLKRASAEAFTAANPGWARILRGDFRKEDATVVIISAAQVALARAEAAQLGWTTESAQAAYNQGIALSFEQWGIAVPAGYLTQASVVLDGTENVKKISTQRYIASYPDGLQSWNIWRKSGYPVLTPAPDATNSSKQIPRRYMYSAGERGSNKVNVEEAIARIPNGDTQDSKVWWDQ
ncbi:SusD/RagB family nutrient-binding outer membrane lipoprotein [Solitalea lacus]|uniref:SusD/RagB family nutrient-binding outer membrane lipoprotein n=1 Tax=Solitalea lacus TaxID=2911172 RepID=UPI001EDA428F|nr:SusD/RagB family nutrient-binding outer membrane lipoprotein [Solitalea lacus]UKJ07415.1 SusD/RagB family nutrient-binding outer membrane lipoprotein [Solitalea lacus]